MFLRLYSHFYCAVVMWIFLCQGIFLMFPVFLCLKMLCTFFSCSGRKNQSILYMFDLHDILLKTQAIMTLYIGIYIIFEAPIF